MADAKVPVSAAWLGGLGAVPFLVLAGATPWLTGASRLFDAQALGAYGAVILSFLGGVHWGLAIAGPAGGKWDGLTARLTIGVAPSLAAWSALLMPGRIGLFVLAASVGAMLWVDLRATRLSEAPAWYPKLRVPLTVAVVAALLFGALA